MICCCGCCAGDPADGIVLSRLAPKRKAGLPALLALVALLATRLPIG